MESNSRCPCSRATAYSYFLLATRKRVREIGACGAKATMLGLNISEGRAEDIIVYTIVSTHNNSTHRQINSHGLAIALDSATSS